MIRVIAAVVVVVGFAAQARAQDNYPPTAPTGFAVVAAHEEDVILHWKLCFDDIGGNGLPTLDVAAPAVIGVVAAAAAAGPVAVVPKPMPPIFEGGGSPSGKCDHYELRISTSLIDSGNFSNAFLVDANIPANQGGTPEVTYEADYTVSSYDNGAGSSNIVGNTQYYFGIRAYDEAGQYSTVTVLASPVTTAADPLPPGAVTNLALTNLTSDTVTVQWGLAADDAGILGSGAVDHYTIRYWDASVAGADFNSGTPVSGPIPADPNGPNPFQSVTISGLSDANPYGIGISTNDGTNSSSVVTLTFLTFPDGSGSGDGQTPVGCSASVGSFGLLASIVLACLPLLRKPA